MVTKYQKQISLQYEDQGLMRAAMSQMQLSARAYHSIVKLGRTIADLARCEEIQSVHLAEALHASQSSKVDVGVEEFQICIEISLV